MAKPSCEAHYESENYKVSNSCLQEAWSQCPLPSLCFSGQSKKKNRMTAQPLICWDIFDFSSETTERNPTKLDRKQDLNVIYQTCFSDWSKKKMSALASDCWHIQDFSFESAEQDSMKLDWKHYLNILCQVCVFGSIGMAHCQVSLNSVQWFQRRGKNVSANQKPWRLTCFSNRFEKHKLGRGRWDLASCQVSLNSVQQFQSRSRKCEKVTTTDDRKRVITIVHMRIRLRCTNQEAQGDTIAHLSAIKTSFLS